MTTNSIYLEKKDQVATIYFNRPEKRNALTLDMWKRIPELVGDVEKDSNIKVLILRGVEEKSFAAGADISEFQTIRSTAKDAKAYNAYCHKAEQSLKDLVKPTIAVIQGYCIGGGLELALACDFRFSDTNGVFGITPAKLGLVYGLTASKTLVDLVGPSNAKYILFSGRQINVHKAEKIGLVNEVFSPDEIEKETYQFAYELCERAQFAIRSMNYIISEIMNGVTEDTPKTNQLCLESFETEDYQEGVKAFLEKRKPEFKYS